MANQYVNKLALKTGEILFDVSQDDVKPEHVQKGIHFHDKSGAPREGTNTKTVDASEVTTEAAEVLAGKKFGKGNNIEVGTMPDNSGVPVILSNPEGTLIPRGHYDGATPVKLSDADLANLKPENIKEGITLLGKVGSYGADDISSQSKEVEPTFEEQIINPDTGYAFLSSVKVNPIKITRTDNDAGGVTVTIG